MITFDYIETEETAQDQVAIQICDLGVQTTDMWILYLFEDAVRKYFADVLKRKLRRGFGAVNIPAAEFGKLSNFVGDYLCGSSYPIELLNTYIQYFDCDEDMTQLTLNGFLSRHPNMREA